MKMILMGTGTSHGVPVIGCECKVCQSTHKEDKRTRCSAYIECKDTNIVIDVGPEFRIQALNTKIKRLDAVLITHTHADHCHGLDDIRVFSHTRPAQAPDGTDLTNISEEKYKELCKKYNLETEGKGIPIYSNEIATEDLYVKFNYIFNPVQLGGGLPKLNLQNCEKNNFQNPLKIGSINAIPIPMYHGKLPTFGWIIQPCDSKNVIAYLTDCHFIPEESISSILNSGFKIEHLIIDALRIEKHSTHCCFDDALSYAEKLCPTHTWFTHMTHNLFHTEIQNYIDENLKKYPNLSKIVSDGGSVSPAFDGLEIVTLD